MESVHEPAPREVEAGPSSGRSASSPPRRRGTRPALAWLAALGAYLPLAAFAFWPVWMHWSQQLNGCDCWDQDLLEWFVNWTPAAVAHGHSVLVTNYIDAPAGVNVMWNTSVLALGAVASPLTETIGVVHTMSVLMTLSFAVSASTMFLLLRRWVRWWPAAWLGGLVYGFSTFAAVEAWQGRLQFVFAAIPPLIVLVVDKRIRDEWGPIRSGLAVGALLAVQLLVSEELLAVTVLFLGFSLLILGAAHWREVLERGRSVVMSLVACAVAFSVIASYPISVQFTGADRIVGPTQTHAQEAIFSSDILSPFTPWISQWLDFSWANRVSGAFSAAGAAEVTEYVGLPLLILVIATVVVLRRRTLVRVFALVALASFLFSLGPVLLVDNHHTGVPGPDAVLMHLPVVGDIIPARFALGFWFAFAVLFATGLDAARAWLRTEIARRLDRRSRARTRSETVRRGTTARRLAAAATACLGAAVLIPVLPNWPLGQSPADIPLFFTSADVNVVPPGSLVATYPYPRATTAWPMLWQAQSGMRYRMLGGYALGPSDTGAGTFFADPNAFESCLTVVFDSDSSRGCHAAQLARAVHHLEITTVIAGDGEQNVSLAQSVLDRTLGAAPRHVGGVLLWRCVPRHGGGCRWT